MNSTWKRLAQFAAVLLIAALVKFYYSTASFNELRWILAPTASLVELISGRRFEFESHAGYMSSDRTFVIAASCAGVNFLITSFLMLSLRKLWRVRANAVSWSFLASASAGAYVATLLANTVRISIALWLRSIRPEIGLSPEQLHRFEGILVYFGFLLLLFLICERLSFHDAAGQRVPFTGTESSSNRFGWGRRTIFPLFVYYGVTLGIPLANGGYRQRAAFLEHALFVLVTPLLLLVPIGIIYLYKQQRSAVNAGVAKRQEG